MASYQRPMVTIDQNLTVAPTAIERDMPAFIFGPHFMLHRYNAPEEKATTAINKEYTGNELTSPYPNVMDADKVDLSYTKLYGDNVQFKLGDTVTVPAYDDVKMPGSSAAVTRLKFYDESGSGEVEPLRYAVGDILKISVLEDEALSEDFAARVVGVNKDKGYVYINQVVETGKTIEATPIAILNGVEFESKNEEDPGAYYWEQGDVEDKGLTVPGIIVHAGLKGLILVDGEEIRAEVLYADLYVTYRELVTSYSGSIHSVASASDVSVTLGDVDPDNPLAMGVYMACLNSTTDDGDEAAPVYFMAVPTNDLDGYNAVLRAATLTDGVYALAPLTRDAEVIEAVRSHVLDMSVKTEKQWRIAFVSAEIPETVDVLNSEMDVNGDSDPFYAVIDTAKHTFKVIKSKTDTSENTNVKFRATVLPGDKVRFGFRTDLWGGADELYDVYTVKRVVNNYTLEYDPESAPESVPASPGKIEVFHVYTKSETAELVAATSSSMASRRMYNVFPPVFDSNGESMTGEFAAAAVAGIVSGTEPQQPITNMTVRGITNIPAYRDFSKNELDIMAAGGTFIVSQDVPNGIVYVRHQISTAYPDGNINTSELSITKNVDNISYAFAKRFDTYVGKYTIHPDFVEILRNEAINLIDSLSVPDSVYGPQLIADQTEVLFVRQNEQVADHVDIGIRIGVPYPCNYIDIALTV